MKRPAVLSQLFRQLDQSFWMDLTSLTTLAADLMWVSLFYYSLAAPPTGWMKASIFLTGIIFGSNILSRLLGVSRIKSWLQRVLSALCMLALLLVSFQVLFFFDQEFTIYGFIVHPFRELIFSPNNSTLYWHTVIVLLMFWRGGSLNAKSLELFSANSSFQLGTIMFIVYGFGFGWLLHAQPTFNFLLFLFFSVLGMGSSRLIGIGILRIGKATKISSNWPVWLLLASFTIVFLSVAIGALLSQPLAQLITFLFVVFMSIFSILLVILLYPIAVVAQLIVALIRLILGSTGIGPNLIDKLKDFISQLASNNDGSLLSRILDTILPWVIGIIVIVLFSLIMLGITSSIWQKNKRIKLLSSDVDLPLSSRSRKPGRRLGLLDRLRRLQRYLAAEKIRRVYANLLNLSLALDCPRPEATTPLEFLPVVCDLIPEVSPELKRITESYNKIRYGELPEDPEEVGIIESDWKKVHAQGSRLILLLKK